MEGKGNERTLTSSVVSELTGEDEQDRVNELEVIFGHYEDIDAQAFRRCANLHKLVMINCRFTRIPTAALRAVRESLVHLCLSSQNISRLETLDLPHLRSLYLQQNRIECIEGLENCRKLRVLWLYGNCVRRIENLSWCTDLRELWLQDNAIQSLEPPENDSGLNDLVNLQTLHLAKNRVRNIDDLQAIRSLVNLKTLSFADNHFGSNPIVRHPDYRVIAISSLQQLLRLDGVEIDASERSGAVDTFLSQALEFDDIVAEHILRYEHELRALQTRKDRGDSNAAMLQRELVEALNEVEQNVARGLSELQQEKNRLLQLNDQHTAATIARLGDIRTDCYSRIDQFLAEEMKILDSQEAYYDVLEQEATAERCLALTTSTIQCTLQPNVAFEQLLDHTPDFQYISSRFQRHPRKHDTWDRNYVVLSVYRFFHKELSHEFEKLVNPENEKQISTKTPGEAMMYLYYIVNEDEVMSVLQHGISSVTHEQLVFFSDPIQALSFNCGTPGTLSNGHDNFTEGNGHSPTSKSSSRMQSHLLLLCQVYMPRVCEILLGDSSLNHVDSLNTLISLATASAEISPSAAEFIHLAMSKDGITGDVYVSPKENASKCVLPEFVVHCSERPLDMQLPSDERCVSWDDLAPEEVIVQFRHAVDEELKAHRSRLYKEIDPSIWFQHAPNHPEDEPETNCNPPRGNNVEEQRKYRRKSAQRR